MMTFAVSANASDSGKLVADALARIPDRVNPSFAVVFINARHNADTIRTLLHEALQCQLLIGSSCNGSFISQAAGVDATADLALLVIDDPKGSYGSASVTIDGADARQSAATALQQALLNSPTPYESPALVWCIPCPGSEEAMLDGVTDVIGPNIPIFGGSCADNDITGKWQCGTDNGTGSNNIAIAVMTPSTPIGMSFNSGYRPADKQFVVTEASGRTIYSLDDGPAATVYYKAMNSITETPLNDGNVLNQTSLHPLGLEIPSPVGVPEFLLIHPATVTEDKALEVFANVETGATLHLMEGSINGLVQRAGRVIENAIDLLPQSRKPAGVLMIYCAGCMMTITRELEEMSKQVQAQFPDIPIAGMYSFGEQGRFLDHRNRHGNLMISAIAFSS